MAAAEGSLASPMCNLAILDSLNENSVGEITIAGMHFARQQKICSEAACCILLPISSRTCVISAVADWSR
ncbi:UNVERIFIED_CONTAM: hypothetical protein Sradi_2976300 [Sesamum radiatum]|uniref:Uncharacterized protein n=1 Tax=Sesamum radiatum TaxID=300843 RepID=A0AAW2RZL7_SESRA